MWNYAFGSNMSSEVFVGRRGMSPLETVNGIVRDHTVAMVIPGIPFFEPSFAALEAQEGSVSHGVLYRLTLRDFRRLLTSEGVLEGWRDGYRAVEVEAETYDGRKVRAMALAAWEPRGGHLPSRRYMRLMIQGAIEHQIDPIYVDYLRQLPTTAFPRPLGFVLFLVLGALSFPVTGPFVLMSLIRLAGVRSRWVSFGLRWSMVYAAKSLWFFHSILTCRFCWPQHLLQSHKPFIPAGGHHQQQQQQQQQQ